MTRVSAEAPPTPRSDTGSQEDSDERQARLDAGSNGPLKPRSTASANEKLLAAAKEIQKATGYNFTRAWEQAVQENPELVGFNPSGGWAKPDDTLPSVTKVGPQTKKVVSSRVSAAVKEILIKAESLDCARELQRQTGKPLAECLAIALECHPEAGPEPA